MKGKITKIHEPKVSVNGDTTFTRVEFEMEDGSWAKTDLCPAYRNYAKWKDLLVVETELDGLQFKRKSEVNADSNIKKI